MTHIPRFCFFSGKAAVVCAGLAASAARGARGRAGVGQGCCGPAAPRTGPPLAGGRRDHRARRWGEQPQAWPASRQAGRLGGGCAGPRKELHFIKELRSRVSVNLPRTAS